MNRGLSGNLDLRAANPPSRRLLQGATHAAERGAPTEAQPKWAICARPEATDDVRAPKFFRSESEAEKFLNSEVHFSSEQDRLVDECSEESFPASDSPSWTLGLRSSSTGILNKHQGLRAVPVRRLANYSGPKCGDTFRAFLPIDKFDGVTELDLGEAFRDVLEAGSTSIQCHLDEDWRFDSIETDARQRKGHRYSGRLHGSIGEIVVNAVYDLEEAFLEAHPAAPCQAVAAFWRSWQVQRHVADFCDRLGKSKTAVSLCGSPSLAVDQAGRARVHLFRQIAAFAHEILRTPPEREPDTRKEVNTQPAKAVSPRITATKWEEIEIQFVSDKQVQIYTDGKNAGAYNFDELGFADRRTGNPKRSWAVLLQLADHSGIIPSTGGRFRARTPTVRRTSENPGSEYPENIGDIGQEWATQRAAGNEWSKIEKRVEEIRRTVRQYFGIATDPIPLIRGTGYKALFKISYSRSFSK